jgi:hypothetical protein
MSGVSPDHLKPFPFSKTMHAGKKRIFPPINQLRTKDYDLANQSVRKGKEGRQNNSFCSPKPMNFKNRDSCTWMHTIEQSQVSPIKLGSSSVKRFQSITKNDRITSFLQCRLDQSSEGSSLDNGSRMSKVNEAIKITKENAKNQ